MSLFQRTDTQIQKLLFFLDPFIKLLPRLVIGLVFIPAGWGKLHNLERTIGYFSSLHIPGSMAIAPITALCEVIFGIFILVGFYTRVACIPLITIMIGAMLTAHRGDVTSIYSLTELNPALYAVIILCILALGSGTFSLDQLFFRRR